MPQALKKPDLPPDPKQEILDKLGDLESVEIARNEVLVAIYRRPNVSPGGIAFTDNTLKEDIYQGKVGLVVKIGPGCQFQALDIKLHDWVVFRPSDTWAFDLSTHANALTRTDFVTCRLVFDDQIRLRIANPQMAW